MNKIFHYGIILFIIVGLIFNKQEAMLKALLQTPFDVFELCKTLILSICLWNGLLKIIQASNMVNHLNFLFKPLLRWIYAAGFSILPTTMMTIRQNYHSQNILAFYPYSLFIGFSITIIGIVIIKVIEHV